MLIEPGGNENVVVLVKADGRFHYYVTEKELWILNDVMLEEYWNAIGCVTPDPEDRGEKTGFDILDETNVSRFLPVIAQYEVGFEELKEYYNLYLYVMEDEIKADLEDIREILPIFYIDFDRRIFISYYSEPGSYEKYLPNANWKGYLMEIETDKEIPPEMRYWE